MARSTSPQAPQPIDPRSQGPSPEFPQRPLAPPGSDAELTPPADHGEESYCGLGRLTGRVALITGGDSGIGRAVAIAFAREGADVAIGHLSEEAEDARETCRWIEQAGRTGLMLPGDLRQERTCFDLVENTRRKFGQLDILVNNAAFQRTRDSIDDIPAEEFDDTFKTNVYAMFWLCRYALRVMESGSVIINTSSIQAYEPSPTLLPYAATKAAIISMTKSLAKMVAARGIRVNAVAPGPVWTPLIPSTLPEEDVRKFGSNTAFGRPAQPVELAPLYVFLASNESRYASGEVYGATGVRTPY